MSTPTEPLFNQVLFNTAVFGGSKPAGKIVQVGEGLLYPALRKANITIGPQRTPSPAQFEDAIDELNRLIGSLNCDPLSIYSMDIRTFPLVKGKKTYTIGQDPQCCEQADFDVPRPQGIAYANTILMSSGTPLRFPLQLYTDQQWANVSLQDIGNSIPWALYNNWNYPISTLYLYGQPISDMLLELYMWHSIPTFRALSDVVILPPGYEDVLVLNLACRLAPHFQRVISPDVTAQARESLMRLLSYNADQPIAPVNGLCRGGDTTFTMIAGAGGRPGGVGLNDPTQSLGDLLVRGSSAVDRLPIGNPGDILIADPASWLGVRWAIAPMAAVQSVFGRTGDIIAQAGDYTVEMITGAMADPLTTRGDLLVRGSTETTRLPAGLDNQVLIADSSSVLGVRWATNATAAVSSVFGRTGAVIAANGDYRADQITNAVDTTQVYNNPPWINSLSFSKLTNVPAMVTPTRSILAGTGLTGGGDLSQDRTLSAVPDSTVQRVQVSQSGTLAGTRQGINFIAGANTTIGALDNAAANRVDVTISSTGGGTGGGVSTWNTRTGAVLPATGDYSAAQVTNAVDTTQSYSNPAWIATLAWGKITGVPALVNSFNGRTGSVMPQTSDYSAAQVTNAVDTTQSYSNPAWITSLAWGKITGVPTLVNSFNGRSGSVMPQTSDYAASQIANAVDASQTYSNPSWISSLAWNKITGAPAIVGQTPWLSNIDGNSYTLRNVTGIAIGINSVPTAAVPLWMNTASEQFPVIIANTIPLGMAGIRLSNDLSHNLLIGIGGSTETLYAAPDRAFLSSDADLLFMTANSERMRITPNGSIGIANTLAVLPADAPTFPWLVVGRNTPDGTWGQIAACGNSASMAVPVGSFAFTNYAIGAAEKRIAEITARPTTAANSGELLFNTANAGSLSQRMSISNQGVRIGGSITNVAGDLGVAREATPFEGAIFFGNAVNAFLYFDGTDFLLNCPGGLKVNGTPVVLS